MPDYIFIKNFILYFIAYFYLLFGFIYVFIHLRYFLINKVPFYAPNFGKSCKGILLSACFCLCGGRDCWSLLLKLLNDECLRILKFHKHIPHEKNNLTIFIMSENFVKFWKNYEMLKL